MTINEGEKKMRVKRVLNALATPAAVGALASAIVSFVTAFRSVEEIPYNMIAAVASLGILVLLLVWRALKRSGEPKVKE